MKKILFAAVLVAGTTLGFAKSSTPGQNFSKITERVVKSKTIRVNSLEEAEKIKGICHTTVITPKTEISTVSIMGQTYMVVEHYWDVTTYWYGC